MTIQLYRNLNARGVFDSVRESDTASVSVSEGPNCSLLVWSQGPVQRSSKAVLTVDE